MEIKNGREASLMFSGGLDTTLTAILLSKEFDRIHLLTYNNGFCIGVNRFPRRRVQELWSILGKEKFLHQVINIRKLFAILRKDLGKYYWKYKSPLVFDLCCRLAMETRTIIYNLENGITYSSCGTNAAQSTVFIQQAEYLKAGEAFMRSYKIKHLTPTYDYGDRDKRRETLHRLGFDSGAKLFTFLERRGLTNITDQPGKQPICLAAPPISILTSPIRNFPLIKRFGLPVKNAIEFRHNREKIAREYIRSYFQDKGTDLDKLLAERLALPS